MLERALTRAFIGSKVDAFRSAMDLEHSFGPANIRGRLLRGTAADAVIGVSYAESAATVDGILTIGILWLDYCRKHSEGRRHFGGLKVIVPPGAWRTSAERMAWLNLKAADFQLFTLDPRSEELVPVDYRDTGNFDSRLVHAFSSSAALERCQLGIDRLTMLLPEGAGDRLEICARSASEACLLLHGLEFARVRYGVSATSFAHECEVTFGAGANEHGLRSKTSRFAANSLRVCFRAVIPRQAITIPSSDCSPNDGLNRVCAPTSPRFFPACGAICSTARFPRFRAAIAACSTCLRSTAMAGWR